MAQPSRVIPIISSDSSQIGHARRQALSLASAMGFGDVRLGQLGIIVTEAARNIAMHAEQGEIILSPWKSEGEAGIDVLAIDHGKGISDVARSFEDGYSTAGTAGEGLGAMARLAGTFQIYSAAGHGTALFARIFRQDVNPDANYYPMSAISLPLAGESMCGDAWSMINSFGRSVYIVLDGLGHGPSAAEAAQEGVRIFQEVADRPPERILSEIHSALTKTRGAAVSVAEILHAKAVLNYAGIGNIVAAVHSGGKTKSMVSMNGTIGHTVAKFQQFSYPFERNSTLIMHSDGLSGRWDMVQYPGLASRHPAVIAGVLFRDFSRKRDDATILVSRIHGQ